MTARINVKTRTSHAGCRTQAEWVAVNGYMHEVPTTVGDVRRCEHRRIQVCYRIGYNAGGCYVFGPLWRTLSRFWTPRLYREAVEALEATPPPAAVPSTLRKAWK